MRKFIFFLSIVAGVRATAQISPLNIGDAFPSFRSDKTINYPEGVINLDDYKGKLLILDFWASYCGGCIKAFPKLNAVQEKYPDRVAIIVVTSQTQSETRTFWKKHKGTRDYLFPVITDDNTLKHYFPYNSIPHIAWIAPDQTVKAITGPEYVTEKNIELVLNNQKVHWPVKTIVERFDPGQSLLTWNIGAGYPPLPVQYTAFSGSLPGLKLYKGVYADSVQQIRRFNIVNFTLPGFYSAALTDMGWQQVRQRIIYKVKDSSRLFPEKANGFLADWDMQNRYCYEAVCPAATTNQQMAKQLITDVNRFSRFNGYVTSKKMSCWVIRKTRKKPGQKLAASAPLINSFVDTKSLVRDISSVLFIRVLDETGGFNGFPVVMAQGEVQDIAKLNKRLGLYGLQLKKKKRKMEVFVVEEK